MPDMLVRLYELPALAPALDRVGPEVVVRRARAPERPSIVRFMSEHFPWWTAEVEATLVAGGTP